MKAQAIHQSECFEAGLLFSKTEGIIRAPETNHAIAETIREAKKATEEGKVILFNFSSHVLMDLVGYNKYLRGELNDFEYPELEIAENLKKLDGYPLPKKFNKRVYF
jgi:tryptophan synthase beta chain